VRIFIEPLDVLFFRDGRPFTAGEQHFAQSIFPPTSLTFQGAIRTKILKQKGILTNFDKLKAFWESKDEICQIIGSSQDGNYGKLRIKGPFIAKKEKDKIIEHFIAPLDIVRAKETNNFYMLRPLKENLFISDITEDFRNLSSLWVRKKQIFEKATGYISETDLEKYLVNTVSEIQLVSEDSFLARDLRLGIALKEGKKISEEGLLYMAEFLKLKEGWGFTLDIYLENEKDLNKEMFPESGFLSLGGERRAVFYFKINERNWLSLKEKIEEKINKTKRFKLILLSPAYLDKGWYATWMKNGEKEGVKFKWVSACVGNFIPIGGWNLANKGYPKPMRKSIPAGSVYFFELEKGINKLFKLFWLNSISEKYREIGFGLTLIGHWDYIY